MWVYVDFQEAANEEYQTELQDDAWLSSEVSEGMQGRVKGIQSRGLGFNNLVFMRQGSGCCSCRPCRSFVLFDGGAKLGCPWNRQWRRKVDEVSRAALRESVGRVELPSHGQAFGSILLQSYG